MCGIAGFLRWDGQRASTERLQAMVSLIRHRGPDASGVLVEQGVGLGHARLSIVDIENGQQPMWNRERTLAVIFNGEIFNHVELREKLAAQGHRFRTRCDTEVILHAYEEFGAECVEQFNGQWALAVWDRHEQKLFLSRDRLGVRPLFYTRTAEQFLFASEIKALFVHPEVRRELSPRGLAQLFTVWTTIPPTTVFESIQELPPGHNLVVRIGQITSRAYWRADFTPAADGESWQACVERLRELLSDATRLRLRADVPVGAYLSGGLDSSVIAALAQRANGHRLRTFSLTFAEPEYDESAYQAKMIRHLGVAHSALRCTPTDIARVLPDVVWHTEKPLLRTAAAPLFLLSQAVREAGCKVVLSGEGADEILGGYDIFKEAKIRRFCARQSGSEARWQLLSRLYPYLPKLQAQSLAMRRAFFKVGPQGLTDPFFSHAPRWAMAEHFARFFAPDFVSAADRQQVLADVEALLPADYAEWRPLCQAQYLETAILLPGYILSSQGDRVTLAHAVESRFPFLDHRLVEFAAKLPPRWKMKGLTEKYLLKRAMEHLLPPEIVQRAKQPYRAPEATSFFPQPSAGSREAYVDELLSPANLRSSGAFLPGPVQRLVEKAAQGKAMGVRDNMALVGILTTQLLVERFVRNFPRPFQNLLPQLDLPWSQPREAATANT